MLVALATYNELENIPTLVEAVRSQLPTADVLVVDDNSPDGTGRWCDGFASRTPWFSVIHREKKLGLGSATWVAMQSAIARGDEFVVTMDADWSHPPDALPRLLAAATDADVVIGSRYCRGGAVENWPLVRRLASRLMNRATRLALGVPARDITTAYRLYRVDVLRRVDFATLAATGYSYLEEILWRLHVDGARIAEVPITFSERRAGHSKINLREAAGKFVTLARLSAERIR